jgi:hypothetical protein
MNPTSKWVVIYTSAAFFYMDNLSGAGFSIDSNETGQRSYKSRHPFWAAHIVEFPSLFHKCSNSLTDGCPFAKCSKRVDATTVGTTPHATTACLGP